MFLRNGWYVRGEAGPMTALLLREHKVAFYLSCALLLCTVSEFPRTVLCAALLLWASCWFCGRLRQRYSDQGRLFAPKSHGMVYWAIIQPLKVAVLNGTVAPGALDEFLEWYAGHVTVTGAGPWGIVQRTPVDPNEWRLHIELLSISIEAMAPDEARKLRYIAHQVP